LKKWRRLREVADVEISDRNVAGAFLDRKAQVTCFVAEWSHRATFLWAGEVAALTATKKNPGQSTHPGSTELLPQLRLLAGRQGVSGDGVAARSGLYSKHLTLSIWARKGGTAARGQSWATVRYQCFDPGSTRRRYGTHNRACRYVWRQGVRAGRGALGGGRARRGRRDAEPGRCRLVDR